MFRITGVGTGRMNVMVILTGTTEITAIMATTVMTMIAEITGMAMIIE
ncbi:MAG TPA: hypothetical protein VF285_11800 [Castellaniella sp.]